jgi:hypothetical protein
MSPLTKEIVNVKANIFSEGIRYRVIIESFCEDGIYCITLPEKSSTIISPGSWIKLKFQSPSGETISMDCRVKWSYRTPPHFITTSIGLHVLNPFTDYEKFITA